MKNGIWKVEVARLCWACQQEMTDEYIIQPTREQRYDPAKDRWEPGVCQRCGKQRRLTKERRYIFNYEGFRERGLHE